MEYYETQECQPYQTFVSEGLHTERGGLLKGPSVPADPEAAKLSRRAAFFVQQPDAPDWLLHMQRSREAEIDVV